MGGLEEDRSGWGKAPEELLAKPLTMSYQPNMSPASQADQILHGTL